MNAETENLIEPTESNVDYWTQRIVDVLECGETWKHSDFEKVIRELLTADTQFCANDKSIEEMGETIGELRTKLAAALAQVASLQFDKEQSINREAEAIGTVARLQDKLAEFKKSAERAVFENKSLRDRAEKERDTALAKVEAYKEDKYVTEKLLNDSKREVEAMRGALEELTAAQDDMKWASDYLPGDRNRRLQAAREQARSFLSLPPATAEPSSKVEEEGEA